MVILRLESLTRYGTLNRLTKDWENVTNPGVTQLPMNPLDEVKLRHRRILTTELWGNIISSYKAISQILDKRNASGISVADNNVGAGIDNISGT